MDGNLKTTPEKIQELKELGNNCVRDKKYEEAVLHYSHAITNDSKNYSLYSNRSLAFLKIQQYYYAMEDAKETIRLKPDWAKGYFRKGEIENATFNFSDAIVSYSLALSLQPNDLTIRGALEGVRHKRSQDLRACSVLTLFLADQQIPWLGAGIGIVLGVLIVIADHVFTAQPTVSHPVLMALLTMSIAMTGYGVARGFRYYITCQRSGLLESPIDLLPDDDKTEEEDVTEGKTRNNNHRYTKAQARFRFRKGKKS